MKKRILTICLMLSLCFIILTGCEFSFGSNGTITNTVPVSVSQTESPSDVAEACIPATVSVFYVNGTNSTFSGSGVAVASGGYIATNWHVISSAVNSSVYKVGVCLDQQNEIYLADILWYNDILDMAIIRSSYHDIPYLEMEDRWVSTTNPLRVLEQVITIGSPISFSLQNTCSVGTISSTVPRYTVSDGNKVHENLIQHSASISNGNSGGPLIDMNGKLIGLNTLGVTSSGSNVANDLYFAVPIYPVMQIIDRIKEGTFSMPSVGIEGHDKIEFALKSGLAKIDEDGFYVRTVLSSGASFGKLQAGNIITKIEFSEEIYIVKTRNDLIYALLNLEKNNIVKVSYLSGNTLKSVNITLS